MISVKTNSLPYSILRILKADHADCARKRDAYVTVCDEVALSSEHWIDGQTVDWWTKHSLRTGNQVPLPKHTYGLLDSREEIAKCRIPVPMTDTTVIVKGGRSCGKASVAHIYISRSAANSIGWSAPESTL